MKRTSQLLAAVRPGIRLPITSKSVVHICVALLSTGSCWAAGPEAPRVGARLFLGQDECLLRTTPGQGDGRVALTVQPGSAGALAWDAATRAAWGLAPPLVDVAGAGHPREVDWQFYERWLPSRTGKAGAQKLTWRWNGTWGQGAILGLYTYEDGLDKPRLVWESAPEVGMHPVYRPYTLVGDFTGSGHQEIAVSRAGGVSIIDALTGRRTAELTYRRWPGHHRYYGFFGAYPNPAGKGTLFVVVGIFSGHVDVISYDGKTLKLLWSHLFDPRSDQGIDRRCSIDRVLPEPVADIDGDGRQEIVLNVFNDTGDRRWHVTGYDLPTGKITVDLPDHYLCELMDWGGAAAKALLAKVLPSRAEPVYSPLELLSLRAGKPAQVLWRTEQARLSVRPPQQQPLDRWWNARAGGGPDSVDYPLTLRRTTEGTEFYLSRPTGAGERLEAWEIGAGRPPRHRWQAILQGCGTLEVVTVGPDQRQVLLRVRSQGQSHVEVQGAKAEVVSSQRPAWSTAPTLALVPNGSRPPTLVAEDASGRLHVLTEVDRELRAADTLTGHLSRLERFSRGSSALVYKVLR